MDYEKMKEFLLMYKSLEPLYDYDVIANLDLLDDMKRALLDLVMDEIEKTVTYLEEQKEKAVNSSKYGVKES